MSTFESHLPAAVDLAELGRHLDGNGFAGTELTLRRVVREARESGIHSPALDVLTDTDAPEVVRLRAFAIVSMRLYGRRVRRSSSLDRHVA